jgi:hypothetical protein
MEKIVKASSGQIFGLLLCITIISGFIDMIVQAGFLPAIIADLMYVVVMNSTLGWILITGKSLEAKKYGSLTRRTYMTFIFVGLLLIVTMSIGRLFSLVDEIMNNAIVQIIFTGYVFGSIFWIATFTAKALKSNETNNEIDINDYFGDIFLIVFWPIGIWSIQPRVNKIFADKVRQE